MTPAQIDTIAAILGPEAPPHWHGIPTEYDGLDFSWPEKCSNDADVIAQLRQLKHDHPDAGWWRCDIPRSWSDTFMIYWDVVPHRDIAITPPRPNTETCPTCGDVWEIRDMGIGSDGRCRQCHLRGFPE